MNKEEYKTYVENQYKNDHKGFKIFLKLLFEYLLDKDNR